MAKITKLEKETMKAKFDPSKSYEWQPDDEFVLTGQEFQLIFTMLNNKFRDEKFQEHVMQYEAFKVMQGLLIKGVEEGIITEKEPIKYSQPSEYPVVDKLEDKQENI